MGLGVLANPYQACSSIAFRIAVLECAAGDHSHSQVQEPGAPGGEYCRV